MRRIINSGCRLTGLILIMSTTMGIIICLLLAQTSPATQALAALVGPLVLATTNSIPDVTSSSFESDRGLESEALNLVDTSKQAELLALLENPQRMAKATYQEAARAVEQAGECTAHENTAVPPKSDDPWNSYTYLTNASTRQEAQVNVGNPSRLRLAMERHLRGENLTLTFLGGSITAGEGAMDGHSYVGWAAQLLHHLLGPRFKLHNGAVPGTLSHYMSACHNVHVPASSDIVFVEYSINDPKQPNNVPEVIPAMDPLRRPYERLLRKLLKYPRRPAVILIHSYMWFGEKSVDQNIGTYYSNIERDFHEFGNFYGLPEVSIKAACYELMRQGHKVMAELAMQPLLDTLADLQARPVNEEDHIQVKRSLPSPMLKNNMESTSDKCLIGVQLVKSISSKQGWEWKADTKDHAGEPTKFGFISDVPGSVLKIEINTTLPSAENSLTLVELAHLRSYESMGQAEVQCEGGCTCSRQVINGHHTDRTSQLFLESFFVSQSDSCTLSITVLQETSSGKHKFKISGVMVSEEANGPGIQNNQAVDMVDSVVAGEGSEGVFEFNKWR
eukprot:gene13622-19500_t